MESTYGIGETARRTGLSVSALRFYDREGVLVPAHVDPRSGYRRYAADQVAVGRLVARLRRVGLPLPDVERVLAHRHAPDVVRAVLDGHLARLEHGLALARHELSAVRQDLDHGEQTMTTTTTTTVTVPAADLEAALRGVRFAVGVDAPAMPALGGVLLDLQGDVLRLVATDRYRLAVSTAVVVRDADASAGADVTALVPAAFADDVLTACATATGDTSVSLSLGPDVTVAVGGRVLTTSPIDEPFPQWEALVDLRTRYQLTLDVTTLRDGALAAVTTTRQRNGVDYPACVFRVSGDGLVWSAADDTVGGVAVNRDFLLEAVDALAGAQLVLGLTGPTSPLALTSPERPGALSILMPVHLE